MFSSRIDKTSDFSGMPEILVRRPATIKSLKKQEDRIGIAYPCGVYRGKNHVRDTDAEGKLFAKQLFL